MGPKSNFVCSKDTSGPFRVVVLTGSIDCAGDLVLGDFVFEVWAMVGVRIADDAKARRDEKLVLEEFWLDFMGVSLVKKSYIYNMG